MEVFTKLSAVENEVFTEMEKIDAQINEMRQKQAKLKNLARVMNPKRLEELKSKPANK